MRAAGGRSPATRTGRWVRLFMEGRNVRATAVAATRSWTPPFRPYVYRGTGADTLTAFMDDLPDSPRRPGRALSQPCGTAAAVRRHYRRGEKPLADHCPTCSKWERRNNADRYAASRELQP